MCIDFRDGEAPLESELWKEPAEHYTPISISLPPNIMTLQHY
jgi:hypothetical protein